MAVPRPGHRRGGRAGRDRRRPGAGDPGRRLPPGDLPLAAPGGAAALVLARPAGCDPAGRGALCAVAAGPAAPLGLGDHRRPRLRGRARRLQRSPGAGARGRDLDHGADAGRLPAPARPRPRPQPGGVGGRRAGRGPVRGRGRRGVHRRVHVPPGHRRLQGRPGRPGRPPGRGRRPPDRRPDGHPPSGQPRRPRPAEGRVPRPAGRGPRPAGPPAHRPAPRWPGSARITPCAGR